MAGNDGEGTGGHPTGARATPSGRTGGQGKSVSPSGSAGQGTEENGSGATKASDPAPLRGADQTRCDEVGPKLCKAMQKASAEGRGSSQPEPQGRCPSSMRREECAAVVKAGEEAESSSHPISIDRCPPEWSRELCEEAIRASREAREAREARE
ncbi:MAG TPA: hypothetical protein VHI77_03215 [Solirubrobacterales bacterium]|nr:hypothetical protein [Solirubrobacterales bacterium]